MGLFSIVRTAVSAVEPPHVVPVHVSPAEGPGLADHLAEPAKLAGDVGKTIIENVEPPDDPPDNSDHADRMRDLVAQHSGVEGQAGPGPHWTVDPFDGTVLTTDPIDVDTAADLADVTDVHDMLDLDDAGLGDVVV